MIGAWLLVVWLCPPARACDALDLVTIERLESRAICEAMLADYSADPGFIRGSCTLLVHI